MKIAHLAVPSRPAQLQMIAKSYSIQVRHREDFDSEKEPEGFVLSGEMPEAVAGAAAAGADGAAAGPSSGAAVAAAAAADDDDEIMIIDVRLRLLPLPSALHHCSQGHCFALTRSPPSGHHIPPPTMACSYLPCLPRAAGRGRCAGEEGGGGRQGQGEAEGCGRWGRRRRGEEGEGGGRRRRVPRRLRVSGGAGAKSRGIGGPGGRAPAAAACGGAGAEGS